MKIAVMGTGAMGGYVGVRLAGEPGRLDGVRSVCPSLGQGAPVGSRRGEEFRNQWIDPIGEFPGRKASRLGDRRAPRAWQPSLKEFGGIEEVRQVVLAVVE